MIDKINDISSLVELEKILEGAEHNKKYILIDFYSINCFPCHKIIPILINISEKNSDIYIAKINKNNTEFEQLVKQYNISKSPTILVFKKGEKDILIRSTGSTLYKMRELEEKLMKLE